MILKIKGAFLAVKDSRHTVNISVFHLSEIENNINQSYKKSLKQKDEWFSETHQYSPHMCHWTTKTPWNILFGDG